MQPVLDHSRCLAKWIRCRSISLRNWVIKWCIIGSYRHQRSRSSFAETSYSRFRSLSRRKLYCLPNAKQSTASPMTYFLALKINLIPDLRSSVDHPDAYLYKNLNQSIQFLNALLSTCDTYVCFS